MLICLSEPKIVVIPGIRRAGETLFALKLGSFRGNPKCLAHVVRTEGGRQVRERGVPDVIPGYRTANSEFVPHREHQHIAEEFYQAPEPLLPTNEAFSVVETRHTREGLYEAISAYQTGARSVLLRAEKQEGNVVAVSIMIHEPEEPTLIVAHRRLLAGAPESWPDPIHVTLQPMQWITFRADRIGMALLDEQELSVEAKRDHSLRPTRLDRIFRED